MDNENDAQSVQETAAEIETVETTPEAETSPETQEKRTYTDADVDRIIAKKVARERERFERLLNDSGAMSDDIKRREADIRQRELRQDYRERAAQDGIPSEVLPLVDTTTPERAEATYTLLKDQYMNAVTAAAEAATAAKLAEMERARGRTPKDYSGATEYTPADAFRRGLNSKGY